MELKTNNALLGLKVARRVVETPVDVNFIYDTAGVPDDLSYEDYLDVRAVMEVFLKSVTKGLDDIIQLLEVVV